MIGGAVIDGHGQPFRQNGRVVGDFAVSIFHCLTSDSRKWFVPAHD
jgi:hypothetical protein